MDAALSGRLERLLDHALPTDWAARSDPMDAALIATSRLHAAGWFDVLGTGWRDWSVPTAGALDWSLDPPSGYRWSQDCWHRDVDLEPAAGVDVKVPWELGRLQHLPTFAIAYAAATSGVPGFADPDRYLRAFERHLTGFVEVNPPRFGVQWAIAMDPAIRIANVLLAWDIFSASGARISPDVESAILQLSVSTAEFVVDNLEWAAGARTNHYIADVCGLAWAAAHLPSDDRTDAWLHFAAGELARETDLQFHSDGSNREASVCYHRLSSEMVAWTYALLRGLSEDRIARAVVADVSLLPLPPRWRIPASAGRASSLVSDAVLVRLRGMRDFAAAASRPDGRVLQIGDNDSGRFFKVAAPWEHEPVARMRARFENLSGYSGLPDDNDYWFEDSLDHRDLIDVIDTVLSARVPRARHDRLVAAYARLDAHTTPVGAPRVDTLVGGAFPARRIEELDGPIRSLTIETVPGLRGNLDLHAFAGFGLYVWRSDRLYVAVHCGPIGQGGRGGHAHNDQLSVELVIDGTDWFRDPGTYVYGRDPVSRNRYRSALAHVGPRVGTREPWSIDEGMFELAGPPAGYALWVRPDAFVGMHTAYGAPVLRHIEIGDDTVRIIDHFAPSLLVEPASAVAREVAELPAEWRPDVPFSPAYGWRAVDHGPP